MAETILIVDDKANVRTLLREYLTEQGFRVVTAENGRTALFVAREASPDLILLDFMMPEIDGYAFIRTYRREADVPIILLTARLEENDKVLGLELGADDYVTKPFGMREQARQQGVDLRVAVAPDLPPARMDPERIRQVLGNRVSNALRYTSAGDSVLLKATPENASHLLLSVRDTGAGIAAQDLPHVFNRFYRGDKARSKEQGASGLGLAIARSLVEMHGGTIGVESASGSGTVFRIRLPL